MILRNLCHYRPARTLTMKKCAVISQPGQFQHNVCMHRCWHRVQYLCDPFWSYWKREYLPALQQQPKWNQPKRNIEVNNFVLIKDENESRNDWWLMDIILKVEPDPKGFVRSAVVKKKTSKLRRPVHKLVLFLTGEDHLDIADNSKDADKP